MLAGPAPRLITAPPPPLPPSPSPHTETTNYLQVPPDPDMPDEATQAPIRARQELRGVAVLLGVHSTALFCTPASGRSSTGAGEGLKS
jgi:hypothetical protein